MHEHQRASLFLLCLQQLSPDGVDVPLALIGSEFGGEGSGCAPRASNYRAFYAASRWSTLEVEIKNAGHFQFLDRSSPLDRVVCVEVRRCGDLQM